MSRKPWIVVGLVVAALGVLVLALVGAFGRGSPREHIAERYQLVSRSDGGRSTVYRADREPSAVVADLTDSWSPAQRHTDATGYFLRYRSAIVAVTPDDGGSRIWVDDEDTGYARWYPYVGGWWGTYSGPGETFRGGGPGSGK